MLANPKRKVDTYSQGIQAIMTVGMEERDIRRFDLAMVVRSGEVPVEEINQRIKARREAFYSSDRCSLLIMWIWSRDSDQIVFTESATQAILEQANVVGKKYNSKIPLCEPADMRFKLARGAACVAGRLYNSPDGERLIVDVAHVESYVQWLQEQYDSPTMSFDIFSRNSQTAAILDPERKERVRTYLQEFDDWPTAFDVVLRSDYFSLKTLTDRWIGSMGRDNQAKTLIRLLSKEWLIEQSSHGYYKTAACIQLMKELLREEGETTMPAHFMEDQDEVEQEQELPSEQEIPPEQKQFIETPPF